MVFAEADFTKSSYWQRGQPQVSRLLVWCLGSAVFAVSVATLAGLFGPWSVIADAFSHFRLQLAAVAFLLAILSAPFSWRLPLVALAVAAVNVGGAMTYPQASRVADGSGRAVKVMTFNVLYRVDNDAQILAQIFVEQPDIVLLQELTHDRRALLAKLRADYPWQVSCSQSWRCDVAIVSRFPWESAEAQPVGNRGAKLAWARFGAQFGGLQVASVHLKWPLVSDQTAQLAAVKDVLAGHSGPTIVAGDLNAVPWSAAVRSFTRQTQLRSAGGFMPTWPRRTFVNGRACIICVPQLQIDHIFVSPHVGVRSVHPGPDVGSDHLPLVAVLELPANVASIP